MYRDEQDALRARVDTLEAELEAERAGRVAAEARTRAHQARAQEAARHAMRREPVSPLDDIVGWWAKPWIAVAVSAMLALGVYMALRVSHEAARSARFHRGYASCPHRADTLRVRRTLVRRHALVAACKTRASLKAPVLVRVQVDRKGVARVLGMHSRTKIDGKLKQCVERALHTIEFSPLTQSRPINAFVELR